MIAKFFGGPLDEQIKEVPDEYHSFYALKDPHIHFMASGHADPAALLTPVETVEYRLVDKWTDETGTFAQFQTDAPAPIATEHERGRNRHLYDRAAALNFHRDAFALSFPPLEAD